jgi:parvulin-like peptidyl-prolyl isomerase
LAGWLLILAACSGREAPPGAGSAPAAPDGATIVAEVGGKALTVSDLNRYLRANLLGDEGEVEAEISPGDLAILRSRLFDSFVDEEVLLHEAEREGIAVQDDELEAYVEATAPEEPEDGQEAALRREMARNDLVLQKLRAHFVQSQARVTPEEVAEYVARHRDELEPEVSLVLRSLAVATEVQAAALAAEVGRGAKTFDQAVEAAGSTRAQAAPMSVALDSLPAEVRAAVADLPAGAVSKPVIVNARPYLFHVESWIRPTGDVEAILRRRAEHELLSQKQEEASRTHVDVVRQRVPVKIYTERLPFRYAPVE